MAAEPSMGVNPALLTLNPAQPDENDAAAPSAASTSTPAVVEGEETFIVDKLLDFRLHDNKHLAPQEAWPNPEHRFEVRFLVSWVNYGPQDNSWEPREMFDEWPAAYDDNIVAIESADPSHRTLAALEKEVKRLNTRWRKKEKEREREDRKERKAKSGKGKAKKDKGKVGEEKAKVKDRAQEEVEVETRTKADAPSKPKQTRTTSSASRAGSAASSSTLAGSPAGLHAPRTRHTRRSIAENDIDPHAWHEYLETNAPSDLRKLRRTPSPERDENGRLISPPSSSVRGESADERAARSMNGLGIVGAGGEDVEMEEAAAAATYARASLDGAAHDGAAPGAHAQPCSVVAAGGFAGSDDSEGSGDEAASAPAPTAAPTAVGGFAKAEDDSEDDGAGAYFPQLVPPAPSQSQPASAPPPQEDAPPGSPDSSHDRKPDITSHLFDVDTTMDTAPTALGTAGASSAHELGTTSIGGDGEGPCAPAASASAASGQDGAFADSDSSDEEPLANVVAARLAPQPLASTLADGEDEKPPRPAQRSAAPRAWAGDSDDDDDDDEVVIVDVPEAPAAPVPSAATAAARPAPISGGFAESSDEDEPVTLPISAQGGLASPPRQQQPPAAPSGAASAQAPEQRSSRSPAGVGVPLSTVGGPALVNSTSSRRASTIQQPSPSLETSSGPSSSGRPLKRARPSDEVRSARVDGPGDSYRAMSPPSISRAQQLKRLKIGRVGQRPPPPPPPLPPPAAPSPATSAAGSSTQSPIMPRGSDRAPYASAVSSETSSLGSGAQARKLLDPFNHGIRRPKSSNGYVVLNADLLRAKKLSTRLAPNLVRYPPGVESEVDRVRHLWGIRTSSGPVHGVYNFNDAMHLDGEPREAFIAAPPDENVAGRDKVARGHRDDYEALQLVLTSVDGVKQADSPRDSVTAVFVHTTELEKVGKFPDGLLALEPLRMGENNIFFVYGADKDRKRRPMRPFWHPITAFTFTPAAFRLNPARISALVDWAPDVFSHLGYRSQFPWIPAQYLLRGGAHGPAEDAMDPDPSFPQEGRSALTVQLHSLAVEGKLAVANVAPCSSSSHNWLGFPDPQDGPEYGHAHWGALSRRCPPSWCFVDLAELQRLVCDWRCEYTQVRRWLVIATPEEMAQCSALSGIYLFSVAEAEQALA
ncbi:hypothetical protein JCM9279_001505 [Rhodotorula babjevae]